MAMNLKDALRMAKASDATYYLSDIKSAPNYNDIGFKDTPKFLGQNDVDAAYVGTTSTEIVVAFRGTLRIDTENVDALVMSVRDWANNGKALHIKVPYSTGEVHLGFSQSLEKLWTFVLTEVKARHLAQPNLPVVVTGHSKGGALATLAALRLRKEVGVIPAAVYTYGSPRTGTTEFADDYNTNQANHWRIENADDLVPHVPPVVLLLKFLGQIDPRLAGLSAHGYNHVGQLKFLDWGNVGRRKPVSAEPLVGRESHRTSGRTHSE